MAADAGGDAWMFLDWHPAAAVRSSGNLDIRWGVNLFQIVPYSRGGEIFSLPRLKKEKMTRDDHRYQVASLY